MMFQTGLLYFSIIIIYDLTLLIFSIGRFEDLRSSGAYILDVSRVDKH